MYSKISKLMRKNRKGFTLVELMVVIVIIGILTAIAVPVYNVTMEKAKLNTHMTNINTIEGAIEQCKQDNATTSGTGIDNTKLTGNYIKAWPTEPGTYTVTDGVLTASPTKADTQTAIGGGTAVTWP